MYRTTHRIRKAGVAALVAALALSGLVFAPSADAATPAQVTLTALAQPTIGQGKTNQAAGPLRLTVDAGQTLTAGDAIRLTVDDAAPDEACAAGDTVAFSALPTVTVTGTATVVPTLESSAAGCGNDRLFLNVTGGGSATINITNINYNTGATTEVGPVDVTATLNGTPVTGSGASNAFITTALFTANNPPKGAAVGAGTFAISPLVITEQTNSAADNDFCIALDSDDLAVSTLAVAASGGNDSATATADPASNTIFVDVTSGAASATTFSISGVLLERDSKGVKSATLLGVGATVGECASDVGAALSTLTNIGGVTDVERYGGSTRFTTAQILFEDRFECEQDWAIIARADLYPDALAASYLAGKAFTGILLTNTNDIPSATINALRNEGVRNVYLMGGTHAISAATATQFDGLTAFECDGDPVDPDDNNGQSTLAVTRIGGADRYETAALVSTFPGLDQAGELDITPTVTTDTEENTAIVALGENFPDALAAGPLAFNGDGDCCPDSIPMLLTRQAAVPATTMGALGDLGIVNVIVTGGTVAVSDAAVAQLTAAGYNVRRIAGTTRQGTAVALATAMIMEWGFDDDDAAIARGDDFPDSLTGGPWAGSDRNGQVILLTGNATTLSPETTAFISAWEGLFGSPCDGELDDLDIFGGTVAVAAATVQAAVDAASVQRGAFACL